MIQFLLNRELRTEHALDPNVTVLNYLREHVGKSGTKEGCASGDCGACTVVVGELDGERVRYRTLNSCLTFVSSLHGKQLITVEDLKHQGKLHSVQQAMVDCHGSQCGFCTPGFVMSLFALQKNSSGFDKADTMEAWPATCAAAPATARLSTPPSRPAASSSRPVRRLLSPKPSPSLKHHSARHRRAQQWRQALPVCR